MNHVTVDPPRRKRLKVVRACSECRRKKTKCDGEQLCAPCRKTHSSCQYTNTTTTNTKLVQQKQTQPLTDSASQVTPTTINTLNTKRLSTVAIPTSSSMSISETNQSTCTITTNSTPSASPSTDALIGTSRHDIRNPITATATSSTRPRSPLRKPLIYTIQAIEQRLLEIEKTLGLLLQRHYPALPALVLSSPSSSASSSAATDASFTTHTKESMAASSTTGTVSSSSSSSSSLSSQKVSQELTFGDHHSPRNNLTLPPLQTRPLTHDASVSSTSSTSTSTSSSSSDMGLLLPYYDTGLLFDRKIPVLQSLLPQHQHRYQKQQDSKTGPSTMAPPPSPTYHYHHSPLHPITLPPPSCTP